MEQPKIIHTEEGQELSALLAQISVGEPLVVGGEVLVPLLQGAEPAAAAGPEATLLGEALQQGKTVVTEICLGGSVNQVRVRHDGEQLLLLLDGDQLLGARQNRVFNASFLVAPGSEVVLPVSCVERGRWAYREQNEGEAPPDSERAPAPMAQRAGEPPGIGNHFVASEMTATMVIRSNKLRRVTTSMKTGRGYDADQAAVWSDVDKFLQKSGVFSRSAALEDAMDARRGAADQALAGIRPQATQLGIALVCQGKLAAIDLFGSPGLYARSHDKIMRGVLAGIAPAKPSRGNPRELVTQALAKLRAATPHRRPAPGCGHTLHGEHTELAFAAVVHQGHTYHALVAGA